MRISMIATSFVVLAFASGCNRGAEEQRKREEEIAKVRREAEARVQSARDKASEELAEARGDFPKARDEFRTDMDKKISKVDKDIADLEAKAQREKGQAKVDLDSKLTRIKKQREAFGTEYRSLDNATAATWDKAKENVKDSWHELEKLLDEVK